MGHQRKCRSGDQCLFRIISPTNGEGGKPSREFLLEHELKAEQESPDTLRDLKAEPGYCIDCLLYSWTEHVTRANASRVQSRAGPMNTFTVLVGPGEYARECMLDTMTKSGHPTGIEGHVPKYSRLWRDWRRVPAGLSLLGKEVKTPSFYLAEVNMDPQ